MKKRKMWALAAALCATLSLSAQTGYLTDEEAAVWRENSEQMDSQINIQVQDKLREIRSKYVVTEEMLISFNEIVYEQEVRKLIYNYMYPEDHIARFQKKIQIESQYKNAIDRILFLSGNDMASPKLHLAIRYANHLSISPEQKELLTDKALDLKKGLDKDPRKDVWKQELQALQDILTEEQFDRYFTYKNAGKITRDTRDAWTRLKDAGLTTDLDSTKSYAQIYMHKLKIQKATDIYTYDENARKEAWAAIDLYAPLPIKRLYSINRKNQAKKQGYRGSFTW